MTSCWTSMYYLLPREEYEVGRMAKVSSGLGAAAVPPPLHTFGCLHLQRSILGPSLLSTLLVGGLSHVHGFNTYVKKTLNLSLVQPFSGAPLSPAEKSSEM
jgi:hypothetical protein